MKLNRKNAMVMLSVVKIIIDIILIVLVATGLMSLKAGLILFVVFVVINIGFAALIHHKFPPM
jgi:hypothetical protein